MLRNRKGFTLIELLIVVVIIGILAAIALPKFGQTRDRAYVSTMQSDLRQMATAQEMCYQDNGYNYCDLGELTGGVGDFFAPSTGVDGNVGVTVAGDGQSFTATAGHDASESECEMSADGEITCSAGT